MGWALKERESQRLRRATVWALRRLILTCQIYLSTTTTGVVHPHLRRPETNKDSKDITAVGTNRKVDQVRGEK